MEATYDSVTSEELTTNEIQAREKMSGIKELAASIEAQGLHNPLQVWDTTDKETGEPKKVLLAGHRRLAAILLLIEENRGNGFAESIPARLIQAETEAQARAVALSNNIEAEALTTYEIAQETQRLKALGETQKSIAKAINRSETWVSRKLNTFEAAGKELKKAWKAGKLPDDSVEDIAELDEAEQEAAVADLLEKREAGSREGKGAARKAAKEKAGKAAKPGAKVVQEMVVLVQESKQEKTDYVRGIFDALRFSQGSVQLGKLDAEWKEFVKEESRLAKERAAEEAAEAKAKLEAKKAKGKGGKKAKKSDEDEDEEDDE